MRVRNQVDKVRSGERLVKKGNEAEGKYEKTKEKRKRSF